MSDEILPIGTQLSRLAAEDPDARPSAATVAP